MGSDRHYPEEAPAHQVSVGGFWIDRHTVTNAEFARFVHKTGHVTVAERPPDPADYPRARPELLVPASTVFRSPPHRVDLANHYNWWAYVPGADWHHPQGPGSTAKNKPDHPVVHLAWADVEAYAAWAGKQLPTEAEWEFAARGGLEGAEYVWGDELTPVGRYPANGYGLLDMIGHLWEWTADWYQAHGELARLLHRRQPTRRGAPPQRRPQRPGQGAAQGDEGRLPPVRPQLLPPLPPGRPHGPAGRHRNVPPRVPLHHPGVTVAEHRCGSPWENAQLGQPRSHRRLYSGGCGPDRPGRSTRRSGR
jgi:hypothetical protein